MECLIAMAVFYGFVSLVGNLFGPSNSKQYRKINQAEAERAQARAFELEEIEDRQIRARNLDKINPSRFETLIIDLYNNMGFRVHKVGGSGDEGIDAVGTNSEGKKVIIQCKRYSEKVGAHFIREFYGSLIHEGAHKGYIVTTGKFTQPAIEWGYGKNIELVDREKLALLLDRYLPSEKPDKQEKSSQAPKIDIAIQSINNPQLPDGTLKEGWEVADDEELSELLKTAFSVDEGLDILRSNGWQRMSYSKKPGNSATWFSFKSKHFLNSEKRIIRLVFWPKK